MRVCQNFATLNRRVMANAILKEYYSKIKDLSWDDLEHFETIHNYISFKDNIVRKGAISANKDEIILIPINMRDGCIIAKGKGNEDWNCSAPHGAGRILSRKEAKQILGFDEFEKSMEGIYSSTVKKSNIDEAPMAYKPMDEILEFITDTAEIIKVIKPIYNFKATR